MYRVAGYMCLLIMNIFIVNGEKNCDRLGVLLYEDIGCSPVIPENSICPIKYECEDFAIKSNNCSFRGKTYGPHEILNTKITYPYCQDGCVCQADGNFRCFVSDCPEWFNTLTPGCYRKYQADKCCSTGEICPQKMNRTIETCTVDGKQIREGEKFYPKSTCSKCVCPQNFTGKLEPPYCQRISCYTQISNSDKLKQVCAPFYHESVKNTDVALCCPSDWICPSHDDEIIKLNNITKEKSDLTCKFGKKTVSLGDGFVRDIVFQGNPIKVKCECILPPFLTCREN